jgi:hypothetical protein
MHVPFKRKDPEIRIWVSDGKKNEGKLLENVTQAQREPSMGPKLQYMAEIFFIKQTAAIHLRGEEEPSV